MPKSGAGPDPAPRADPAAGAPGGGSMDGADVRSWLVDIDGPVHVADFGGTGPTVILLHGLGGSHANWLRVGARLTRIGRVLCPDLPGFGRTRLAGRDSSLEANQDVVSRLMDVLGTPPALLIGNSMGATIALRVAAA